MVSYNWLGLSIHAFCSDYIHLCSSFMFHAFSAYMADPRFASLALPGRVLSSLWSHVSLGYLKLSATNKPGSGHSSRQSIDFLQGWPWCVSSITMPSPLCPKFGLSFSPWHAQPMQIFCSLQHYSLFLHTILQPTMASPNLDTSLPMDIKPPSDDDLPMTDLKTTVNTGGQITTVLPSNSTV